MTAYETDGDTCRPTSPKRKRVKLTSTERSAIWKFKFEEEDPLGYKSWCLKKAEDKRLYRKEVYVEGGERLKIAKEKAALRARRYRAIKENTKNIIVLTMLILNNVSTTVRGEPANLEQK
jgi:hypothetical protein